MDNLEEESFFFFFLFQAKYINYKKNDEGTGFLKRVRCKASYFMSASS